MHFSLLVYTFTIIILSRLTSITIHPHSTTLHSHHPLSPLRRYEQSLTPASAPPRPHPLPTSPHLTLVFVWLRGTAACSIRSHSPSLAVLSAVALCIAYLCPLPPPPSPWSHCPLLYSYPHHVSISVVRIPYS
ncbi:hypothetical protein C8Q74DRAFT_485980 [Fomes fomentarius]|nr:hypothetical protein C8Q74DRAFT_485980 [Fomes fomentarius]